MVKRKSSGKYSYTFTDITDTYVCIYGEEDR